MYVPPRSHLQQCQTDDPNLAERLKASALRSIFKHSSNKYDSDVWFFPGIDHFDGSIEGAMQCVMEAYPA